MTRQTTIYENETDATTIKGNQSDMTTDATTIYRNKSDATTDVTVICETRFNMSQKISG